MASCIFSPLPSLLFYIAIHTYERNTMNCPASVQLLYIVAISIFIGAMQTTLNSMVCFKNHCLPFLVLVTSRSQTNSKEMIFVVFIFILRARVIERRSKKEFATQLTSHTNKVLIWRSHTHRRWLSLPNERERVIENAIKSRLENGERGANEAT